MTDNEDLFGGNGGAGARRTAAASARTAAVKVAKAPPQGMPGESGYDASAIEVLEGLEPVRRRPGMYIGGTDEKALHHLFAEVIDNSMDEAVAGHATFIEVELEEGGWLSVADNGRGIPRHLIRRRPTEPVEPYCLDEGRSECLGRCQPRTASHLLRVRPR